MDLKHVVKLLELMENHGLDEVEVEQGGLRIRLKKGGAQAVAAPIITAPMPMMPVNQPATPAGATAVEAAQNGATQPDNTVEVTSPMVGTFYRSPAPDAESFVSEGDMITADTVVCIIEAMKVMNEIKAEKEGEIVKILIETGESVEYGQPIMIVRKPSSSQ